MPRMIAQDKWTLYKHTCSYDLIKAVALDVKNSCKTDISETERYRMQDRLAAINLYKTRNTTEKPLDSINHRINTLEFYMFGYEDKVGADKKFIFSPLGNLFLKYISDEEKARKIFIAMLFGMQFSHPCTTVNQSFNLYPFRLIFKLLTDERLEGKLYNFEYACVVAFVKSLSFSTYERLVKDILSLRSKSKEEISILMKKDEHAYVNAVHEWQYFMQTLLNQIGIIDKFQGEAICKLYHPSKPTSHSLPTARTATTGYIKINSNAEAFVSKMLCEYSCFDMPVQLNDPERLYIDCVKEVYSFYPQILLKEIGEDDELSQLLELPKLIEKYSNNPDNDTAYLFEDVLTDGFNMFYNVEAKKRGGAAHTDIECLYMTKKKKFAVESKSTANKLLGINAGRLREHREEIGGEYTIVVTSRYVPATKRDIKGAPIVIILANTFAEYLYNHIFHEIRNIDFKDFDDIIVNNLGKDVSDLISDLTLNKFATNQ
ncbi:MAG: restriction endonuclease [Clostridia bacterium]|nr:restriction endonuclease [Clostridia bacterium]